LVGYDSGKEVESVFKPKKTESPIMTLSMSYCGNPAFRYMGSVIFRPYLTIGLANNFLILWQIYHKIRPVSTECFDQHLAAPHSVRITTPPKIG